MVSIADEAQVVLIIETQNEVALRMADIARNRPYLRNPGWRDPPTLESRESRATTPYVETETLSWELRFPREEWMFGSGDCDFQLADDQTTGVSRQQFRIYHNEHSVLMIENLSRRGTFISDRSEFQLLRESRILGDRLDVRAGALQIQLTVPKRSEAVQRRHLEYIKGIRPLKLPTVVAPKDVTPAVVPLGEANIDVVLRSDIGQGQFGMVYIGIEKTTGRTYAVKVIDKKKLERSGSENRLGIEKIIAGMVSHANIVSFLQVKDECRSIVIIMELAMGDLTRHPLTLDEVYTVGRQQCSALAYLHQLGITHRDVKPSNILVMSRTPLVTKLADFGESTLSPEPKTYAGTEVYMAPELDLGRSYTSKIDVWSLGIVLVQLLMPKSPLKDLREIPMSYNGTMAGLSRMMLEEDPERRACAEECLTHVRDNAKATWWRLNNAAAGANKRTSSQAESRGFWKRFR